MLSNITEIICLDKEGIFYMCNMYWTFKISFVKLFHFLSVCQHGKSFLMHFIYPLVLKLSMHFVFSTTRNIRHRAEYKRCNKTRKSFAEHFFLLVQQIYFTWDRNNFRITFIYLFYLYMGER